MKLNRAKVHRLLFSRNHLFDTDTQSSWVRPRAMYEKCVGALAWPYAFANGETGGAHFGANRLGTKYVQQCIATSVIALGLVNRPAARSSEPHEAPVQHRCRNDEGKCLHMHMCSPAPEDRNESLMISALQVKSLHLCVVTLLRLRTRTLQPMNPRRWIKGMRRANFRRQYPHNFGR